ncbi:MAG: SusD/RagB family nutrient-binding outer membrane lipoprotein [Tannerella sp.]|jgi:hypothetical protein|nr:SusD/RagB family nutrient-binding outer membrane lipoprotein [Tannerella sp.]
MKTIIHQWSCTVCMAGILGMASCTNGFEEMNRNPNAGEETNEIYYLTKVIIQTACDYQHEAYMGIPGVAGRYITGLRNADDELLNWGPAGWDSHYLRLSVNKTLHDLAEKNGREQYMALSSILEVFNFALVTELWGDIPYSEALRSKSDRIIYPKYDRQEEIYPDLIRKLKEANAVLQNTSSSIDAAADVLYGGNREQWRKFANSLRLRLLLRASEKWPDAYSEMQEMVNSPVQYPLFSGNDDDAEIPYTVTHKFPGGPTGGGGMLTDEYAEFIKRRPGKEIIDFFVERQDPRLPVLFDPVAQPSGYTVDPNEYVGVPISLLSPYDYNGGGDHISTLRTAWFYQDTHPQIRASLITYAEVCFILAEAVQKDRVSVNGETAESLYRKGITASLNYWGIDSPEVISAYLSQAGVAYDGTLKQLLRQKWAALFLKGCEGWFDSRRTGDATGLHDDLRSTENGGNAAQAFLPSRYIYPDGERAQNREQYEKAIALFGDDHINTKMWLVK